MIAPVLVTGAAGFAGQHLLRLIAGDGPVTGWHRPGTEHPDLAGVSWAAVELLDRAAVAAAVRELAPSAIYHLAGVPHVGDSWAHAEETLAGNVVGTLNLFDGLRAAGLAPRVLVTGSATIYRPSTDALTEDAPVAPNTPYGTSKLAQEMVALDACRDHGIPVVVTRSFNHIGPLQSPAFAAPGFARQLARIEAGLMPPTLMVGNLEALRDLSDVRDTVRAYRALMLRGRPGACYNVCSGTAISMQTMLDGLRAHVRVPVTVAQDPARMRPADTPIVLGDRARLTADTGWEPTYSLATTLADLVEYWRGEANAERTR
ncbi:MAG: GDP-mannose 4,6-dehydratase [Acidobacteria bacterium]|nr:GDP-mannose 4,6-dehydratase [Acidobacteriota bacterium]